MKNRTVAFVVVGMAVLVGFMYGMFVLGQNSVSTSIKPIPGCIPPEADYCQPGWGIPTPYYRFEPEKSFSEVVNNVCNNSILAIVVIAFLVFLAARKKKN